VLEIGPYPPESGLYPNHFYIALDYYNLLSILLIKKYYKPKEQKSTSSQSNQTQNSDTSSQSNQTQNSDKSEINVTSLLTLGGLVFGLVTFIISPYINSPVLDYHVGKPYSTQSPNIKYVRIDITNSGTATANNVLLSYKAPGATFLAYETQPYLPSNYTYAIRGNNQTGKAFLLINSLPAGSTTVVFEGIRIETSKNQELTTYLRSDEGVAFYNVLGIIAFYIALSAIYGTTAYIFWFYQKKRLTISIVAIGLIALTMFLVHICTIVILIKESANIE